jgi:hypothetical protein
LERGFSVFPPVLERGGRNAGISGDLPVRVLIILALATLLAGCEGDRIKQSKNPPQEQWHFGLLA